MLKKPGVDGAESRHLGFNNLLHQGAAHVGACAMTKAFFQRTMNGLAPSDDAARDMLRGIKIGKVVQAEVVQPRNLEMLRLYWALCAKIGDSIDVDREVISDVLKLRTGHFVTVETRTGTEKIPKSISFAKMSQSDFRSFFERVCREVCIAWLPHMSAKQVQSEVLEMMGITWSEAA